MRAVCVLLLVLVSASVAHAGKPACAEIATPGSASEVQKRTIRIANAARRLACEPALFQRPARELEKTLGLAAGETLEFGGHDFVMFEFRGKPIKTSALLAALGVQRGYLRLHMNAYHQEW